MGFRHFQALWTGWFLAVALATTGATAQNFFDGKTVTIVVGTEAGGGFDLYARAISRHIRKYIPGSPTVIVQNMPGAGSLKAAEYLYVLAPKDGTTFGLIFPGAIIEPLISGPHNYRYDPTKFEYIGSADSGTRLCVTFHTSKIKTFDDALNMPSIIGGSAPGSSTTDYAQMMISLAGAKMRIVNGYKSTIDTMVAIERGEVDGLCGYDMSSFKAQRPDWFATSLANMIVQVGIEPNAELTKMGVPSIWNYISGEKRAIAEMIVAQQEFHRPFVAPPGVPAAQIQVLRTAFMATLKDPEFLADAQNMKLDIHPKDGKTVSELVAKMYGQPPDLIEKMRKALRP
jgi:tripartite-type tricarboxylate transporter receptor subunit TctC